MKRFRKDVLAYLHSPNKKFFHVVVELSNKPGALASVAALVAKSNLNVLSGFTNVDAEGGSGVWSFFAEDGVSNPEQLEAMLRSSPFTMDVEVKEGADGFIVDTSHFPITINDRERTLLMRQDTFSNMLNKVRETFGGAGDVIVFDEGRLIGTKAGENFKRVFTADFMRKNLSRLISLYSSMGWCTVELVRSETDPKSFTVRVSESFECLPRKSKRPSSQFLRGSLSGFVGTMLGSEYRCIETRCIASGDPYCEFQLAEAQLEELPQAQRA